MVFSSLIFLYAFMPACLLFYVLARGLEAKNKVLLVFSLVFYAWGEPKYVLLLILMSAFDWFAAVSIEVETEAKTRRLWLVLAVIFDLALIGFFKYGRLFASVFGEPPEFIANIALPIGISFYTFQLMSYVVDVYRREAKAQRKFWHVLLYASLFHQCIAGPIVRYQTIEHELFDDRSALRGTDVADGICRFCVGLAKKSLLANSCGSFVDPLLLSDTTLADISLVSENAATLASTPVLGLWIGLIVSLLQIYLDFSAYSDMAIGMGRMLGIHYPENFNFPYLSKSVGEYWRRWHMTLGQWFRDYLYYPLALGPSIKVRKFFAKRFGRQSGIIMQSAFTMLIVWFCTGLWHGASWNFALWGLYYFVFLFLEQNYWKKTLEKLPGFVSRLYLWLVLILGRVIFRYESVGYMWIVFKGLVGANGNPFSDFEVVTQLKSNYVLLIICIIAATPLARLIADKLKALTEGKPRGRMTLYIVGCGVIPALLLILSTAALVGNSYNPFLYFKF